jgi:hypothetical protein
MEHFSALPHGRKIDIENLNGVIGRSPPKMEKREQRFVIKCLWLRGEDLRQIYHELFTTLRSDTSSEDSVQYWVTRFDSRDTGCEEIARADQPLTDLAEPLHLFLDDYPFAIARMLSRHFNVSATTAKEILARDLGLREFARRWVPQTLSDPQKVKGVEASTKRFRILNELEVDSFDGITTGDESWFQSRYESSAMFMKLPHDVTPRTRPGIGVKGTTFTIFFTNRQF